MQNFDNNLLLYYLISIGFSVEDIVSHGYSAAELKQAGFSGKFVKYLQLLFCYFS